MTDWLMVIMTTIYVVATILICRYNWISAKAAKQQTEEMLVQYKESKRPVISISFEMIRSGLCCFIIENVGESPAHEVNVNVNDEFIDVIPGGKENSALQRLRESHLFIASKQKFTVFICGQPEFSKVMNVVAKFDVTYDGYSEHHEIDLSQYAYMLEYESPLEDLSQSIKKIKEQDKRFQDAFLKKIPKRNGFANVIVHEADNEDAVKFRVYKAVCMDAGKDVKSIAEAVELEAKECLNYLIELMKVDALVTYTHGNTDDDLDTYWYKK